MRPIAAALLVILSGAASARAQSPEAPVPTPVETDAEATEQDDMEARAERPHIQVLQHPYDISSFYRSGQASRSDFGYEPEEAEGRYPIASFYRSRGGASGGGYSAFWTSGYGGYGSSTRRRGRGRSLIGAARPRALGLNGDLCLFAPTFLAPVGPLTGVFFER